MWVIDQKIDLSKGGSAGNAQQTLRPIAFPNNINAHQWNVAVYDNGFPVSLAGFTASAQFVRSDGSRVAAIPEDCTISNNIVSVIFPQNAYYIPGIVKAMVEIGKSTTESNETVFTDCITLAAISFMVTARPDGPIVDPSGEITADVAQLIADIAAAKASIPSTYTDLLAAIAPTYSSSATYAVGDYVWYDGDFYRCTTAITTAEAWTAAHWTAAVVGNDIAELIRALAEKLDAPSTAGTAGQALVTDGNGGVSWADVENDVDATLTQSGAAADAKKTGDEIGELKSAVGESPAIKDPEETGADLYVCDSSGNVIAKFVDGHIVTKNFDSSHINLDVFMDSTSSDADLYITDSFGNVIAEFADGHIVTKNFDSSDYGSLPEDVSTLQSEVSALKSATSGILYRNKDATDGVYAACRWHQPNSSAKQFCILMCTDIHGDAIRLASMVEYLNAVDAFDAGICLGDIAGNTWQDDAQYYTDCISKTERPFLTVIGNHDAGEGNTPTTSYTDIADLVAKFITPNIGYADLANGEYPSGKSYYFKDFSTHKIRVIVLNNYEYPTDNDGTNFLYVRGRNCWSQDQINWFISVLNSTPTDYGVIIATHFSPSRISIDLSDPFTSSTMAYSTYQVQTMMDSSSATMLPEIVDAWINGTTLSKTYGFTVDGSWNNIVVSADFTSRGAGEFISWICGHLHMSIMASIYGYTDQKCYLVDCSGLGASTQGDTPRRAGTRSEDAICALAVDRTAKTVKLFRVGAHFTMDGKDRLYGQYSYDAE